MHLFEQSFNKIFNRLLLFFHGFIRGLRLCFFSLVLLEYFLQKLFAFLLYDALAGLFNVHTVRRIRK